MSMDPAMMQAMLSQGLQNPTYGGGSAGPQMVGSTSPLNAASQLMQKVMLMRALQDAPQTPGGATGQQQRQATAGVAPTSATINPAMAQNPQVQAMQQGMQQPMQMNPLQQLQQPIDPSLMPTPGYS